MQTDQGMAEASILRNKAFVGLLCGVTISKLGDVCFMVALPWLVLKATGSSAVLAAVMTAYTVPRAALMLVGGALSDRYDSRAILGVASLCQALSVSLIGISSLGSRAAIAYVIVAIIVFGLADAFIPSATQVLLISVIQRERLRDATALLRSATQVCMIVGPAVGGLLVARFGLRDVFIFDALSYLPYALAVAFLPVMQRTAASRTGVGKAIKEGFGYVLADRRLFLIVGAVAAVNFCVPAVTELGLVSICVMRYGSAAVFGGLVASVGIGSLAGIWYAKTLGKGASIRIAMAATMAGLSLCIASFIEAVPVWGLYAQGVVLGALAGYVNLHMTAWLQLNIQSKMLGRVMSVVAFASAALAPMSLMVGGIFAGSKVIVLFFAASLILAIVAAVIAGSRSLRAESMPVSP
jgi:MFS family permease